MTFLQQAIDAGQLRFPGEGKSQKVTHAPVGHAERYADPEERVRAEFYAELIHRYNSPSRPIASPNPTGADA